MGMHAATGPTPSAPVIGRAAPEPAGPAGHGADSTAPDFSAWYQHQYPLLVRTLTAYCGDVQLAGDVASEACTRLYQRWHRRRPDDPRAWVVTTAFNVLKRRQRRSALERRLLRRSYDHEAPTPPDLNVDLWRAVDQLPRRMREAIVLRYVFDLTQQGVAEVMGIAPGSSAALLRKAREHLSRLMDLPQTHPPEGDQP
jgi:RNA polymerase sigma-70 factor (ECF subfamily)